MSIAKVSLGLSVILGILNPPDSVETVEDYKNYITLMLKAESDKEDKPKNPVGRPPKSQHAGYSLMEWKAVREWVEQETLQNPYLTLSGKRAGTVAPDQDNVRGSIRLDNGMQLHVGLQFDGDRAYALFPPSVMEG